jgi:hypothetical protein
LAKAVLVLPSRRDNADNIAARQSMSWAARWSVVEKASKTHGSKIEVLE